MIHSESHAFGILKFTASVLDFLVCKAIEMTPLNFHLPSVWTSQTLQRNAWCIVEVGCAIGKVVHTTASLENVPNISETQIIQL